MAAELLAFSEVKIKRAKIHSICGIKSDLKIIIDLTDLKNLINFS